MDSTKDYADMQVEVFRIQYIDNTFQLVNWTNEEFFLVAKAMADSKTVVVVDRSLFRVSDIRAIVHLPYEEQSDTEKDEPLVETPQGTYDQEMYNLLVDLGHIPPVEGGKEE